MSARLPDPLAVTTRDAGSWRKRAVDAEGRGLYARADCTDVVPELRSIRELAVFGLTGMADCLPVPAGPVSKPSELDRMRLRVDEVERAYTFDTAALQRRIDGLEAERHETNEWVDAAAEALRAARDRIAELEAAEQRRADTLERCRADAAERAERESDPGRRAAWRMLAGRTPEGEHYAAVHRDYRKGRDDLPGLGGQR